MKFDDEDLESRVVCGFDEGEVLPVNCVFVGVERDYDVLYCCDFRVDSCYFGMVDGLSGECFCAYGVLTGVRYND